MNWSWEYRLHTAYPYWLFLVYEEMTLACPNIQYQYSTVIVYVYRGGCLWKQHCYVGSQCYVTVLVLHGKECALVHFPCKIVCGPISISITWWQGSRQGNTQCQLS